MNKKNSTQFVCGKNVTDLTKQKTESQWDYIKKQCNEKFKCDCAKDCYGCKQLTNPQPCQLARLRASMLLGMLYFSDSIFTAAVLQDLFEKQFEPYVLS